MAFLRWGWQRPAPPKQYKNMPATRLAKLVLFRPKPISVFAGLLLCGLSFFPLICDWARCPFSSDSRSCRRPVTVHLPGFTEMVVPHLDIIIASSTSLA
jgi:hypothetical protein